MSYITKMFIKLAFLGLIAAGMITVGLIYENMLLSTGISLAIIAAALTVRFILIARNPKKLEALEISSRDERTIFVAQKSYSFAFWLSLVAEYAAVCALYVLKMEPTAMILNYVICFQAAAYVVSYLYFNRKY